MDVILTLLLVVTGITLIGAVIPGFRRLSPLAPLLVAGAGLIGFVVVGTILVGVRIGMPSGAVLLVALFSVGVIVVTLALRSATPGLQTFVFAWLVMFGVGLVWQLRQAAGAGTTKTLVLVGGALVIIVIGLIPGLGRLILRVPVALLAVGGIALTALPLIAGRTYGANITFLGVQPGELGRVLLIMWLARSVAHYRPQMMWSGRLWSAPVLKLYLVMTLPVVLAVMAGMAANDLGPAVLLACVTVVVVFCGGVRWGHVVWAVLLVAASSAILASVPKVAGRIAMMRDPLGLENGKLTQIGAGLLMMAHGGRGIGRGLPNLIPLAKKDMVLAAATHELGAVVIFIVIAVAVAAVVSSAQVASRQTDDRIQLTVIGLSGALILQTILMTAATLAWAPLTGMPLPFLSLSGSSLLASSGSVAIVIALARHDDALSTNSVRSRSRIVAVLAVLLVAGLVVREVNLSAAAASTLAANRGNDPYVRRMQSIALGRIVTADGVTIAQTIAKNGGSLRAETASRQYPQANLYAALLGDLSRPGLESQLAATSPCGSKTNPRVLNCPTITTTLDSATQKAAWNGMQGRTGAVVATDLKTGGILAYVTTSPDGPATRDRVRTETLAPGSVAKIATAAMAIEAGLPTYQAPAASYTPQGGAPIWAMHKTPCGGTLDSAMATSCNPYFAELGAILGAQRLAAGTDKWLNGQKTLNGMPIATSTLTKPDSDTWHAAAGAIGLGDAQTTPLGLLALTSQVARGGDPLCLHLLKDAAHDECAALSPMPKSAADQITHAMRQTVTDGTASAVPGIGALDVAAKTGTADVTSTTQNATFVAFAPASDPKVAVVVTLDGGAGQDALTGAANAGPIAVAVLKASLHR